MKKISSRAPSEINQRGRLNEKGRHKERWKKAKKLQNSWWERVRTAAGVPFMTRPSTDGFRTGRRGWIWNQVRAIWPK